MGGATEEAYGSSPGWICSSVSVSCLRTGTEREEFPGNGAAWPSQYLNPSCLAETESG